MLPRRADDPLRMLIDLGIIVLFRGVFLLRLDKPATYLDGIQFVCANATV